MVTQSEKTVIIVAHRIFLFKEDQSNRSYEGSYPVRYFVFKFELKNDKNLFSLQFLHHD